MDFILEQGFDVKQGKLGEFQEWLANNEKEIRNSCPEGVEYMGTYVSVGTSEKNAGMARALWRLDSYGAQDALAAAGKAAGTFNDLATEYNTFIDDDRAAGWSQTLLKAIVDATIWE